MDRGSGQIAVEVDGSGPLILCIPGMGESRASFRHLVPGLVSSGYRVAVMDLRGHGESSLGFDDHDDPAAASDALVVLDLLGGGPATIIGNSMGAAAAVLAAAERPEAVERLVLIGPFVRDHGSTASRLMLRLSLMRPWGPALWRAYYTSLFGQSRPDDHAVHVARAIDLLRRPGRWRAFQSTTRTSHVAAEAALPNVSTKTLVIMGEKDRDFSDPTAEAKWVADAVHGEYQVVPGAGHYPMGEQPRAVLDMVLPFVRSGVTRG